MSTVKLPIKKAPKRGKRQNTRTPARIAMLRLQTVAGRLKKLLRYLKE